MVISLISKDFTNECSFKLEKKVSDSVLEMILKNAEYALVNRLSKYNEVKDNLVKEYKKDKIDKHKIKELLKEQDREIKKGKNKIGLVIIWEEHTYIPYKDFNIEDIKKIWQK